MTIDSEQHVKQAICQYLNENSQGDFPVIKPENVVTLRIFEDSIITLVDCGIKGTPKFTIPADKLEFNPKPNIISREEEEIEEDVDLEPIPELEITEKEDEVIFPDTVGTDIPIEHETVKPKPDIVTRAEVSEMFNQIEGEDSIEHETVKPKPEYVDLEEEQPRAKTKQKAANGRRKRGKK